MSFLIPGLSDLVDVLILSLLIYIFLHIVINNRRYQILYVVSLIFVLYMISSFFNLQMLSTILKAVKNLWIVILVVILQPEIREVLSKISMFSNNQSRISKNNLKEFHGSLIDAISAMSFRHIGALIVLEKKKRLNEYINTGEQIDSILSLRLILTIFNPKSVLHDGAIVIREGRIVAAKVVLPLSKNTQFKQKYGTRHLAALGISEVSDALTIVVSEQSGRISITNDGIIKSDIAFEELMQIISDATK